jgi:hypothetical protein
MLSEMPYPVRVADRLLYLLVNIPRLPQRPHRGRSGGADIPNPAAGVASHYFA